MKKLLGKFVIKLGKWIGGQVEIFRLFFYFILLWGGGGREDGGKYNFDFYSYLKMP